MPPPPPPPSAMLARQITQDERAQKNYGFLFRLPSLMHRFIVNSKNIGSHRISLAPPPAVAAAVLNAGCIICESPRGNNRAFLFVRPDWSHDGFFVLGGRFFLQVPFVSSANAVPVNEVDTQNICNIEFLKSFKDFAQEIQGLTKLQGLFMKIGSFFPSSNELQRLQFHSAVRCDEELPSMRNQTIGKCLGLSH